MRLTDKNLEKHARLFAETGPNQGVLIRLRPSGRQAEEVEVVAEACKLLVWGEDKEGWTVRADDWQALSPSVAELTARHPTLSKHHYIPSDMVDWW